MEDEPVLQGALWLHNRCQLPVHRAPERRAVQTLKLQRNRPGGKIPDSGNKFLPRFAGLTGHEQFRRQIPSSMDPTSGDRARPPGPWLQAPSTSTDAQGTWAPPASKMG